MLLFLLAIGLCVGLYFFWRIVRAFDMLAAQLRPVANNPLHDPHRKVRSTHQIPNPDQSGRVAAILDDLLPLIQEVMSRTKAAEAWHRRNEAVRILDQLPPADGSVMCGRILAIRELALFAQDSESEARVIKQLMTVELQNKLKACRGDVSPECDQWTVDADVQELLNCLIKRTDQPATPLQLTSWELSKIRLARACWPAIDLHEADLAGVKLSNANLHGANLHGANLEGANLKAALLDGAFLARTNLRNSTLDGASLGEKAYLFAANLNKASMVGVNLEWACLREADLAQACFRRANLSFADLGRTNLRDADLREAILQNAFLQDCDLTGAVLIGADIRAADFRGVTGLFPNQVQHALIDEQTRLPF